MHGATTRIFSSVLHRLFSFTNYRNIFNCDNSFLLTSFFRNKSPYGQEQSETKEKMAGNEICASNAHLLPTGDKTLSGLSCR
jgi:hypothetical protein